MVAIRPQSALRFGAGLQILDRNGRNCRVRAGDRRRNTATVPGPGRSTNAAGRRSGRRRKGITRLSAFHLGQRDHDALFPPEDWSDFRRRINNAIEALRR